jgi:exodeoxyribonuclease VII small subunit
VSDSTDQPEPEANIGDLPFEEALQRLEAIVEGLEGGQLALEEALERFAEGMKLRTECLRRLKDAETQIEQVLAESEESAEPDAAEPAEDEDPFA